MALCPNSPTLLIPSSKRRPDEIFLVYRRDLNGTRTIWEFFETQVLT